MVRTPHRLYLGKVFHKRTRPFEHSFVYRVFTCLLDIDQLAEIPQQAKGFQYNRFGLFAFYDKDHGNRDGTPLRPWVQDQLRKHGLGTDGGKILLLCYPRILGYVFNPLSVYYCYDDAGALKALIYEVKNTFGEQNTYVCGTQKHESGGFQQQSAAKTFHVSPFIDISGRYFFRFNAPDANLRLQVRHVDVETELFTGVSGKAKELNTRNVLRAFFQYPLMSLKVIAAIHFEALRLWRKGAKVFPHPKKRDQVKVIQSPERNVKPSEITNHTSF